MRHPAHHLSPSQACEIKKLSGNRKELELNSLVIVNWKCVLLKDDLDTDDDHMMNLKTWADSEGKRYPVSIGKTKRSEKDEFSPSVRTCPCSLTPLSFCACVCVWVCVCAAFIIVIGTDGAQAGQVANTLFNILSHLRNANW